LDNQGKNANKELVGPATFYGGVTGAVGGSVAGLLIAEMHKALARSREEKDIE
jgi:gas vesicle protein